MGCKKNTKTHVIEFGMPSAQYMIHRFSYHLLIFDLCMQSDWAVALFTELAGFYKRPEKTIYKKVKIKTDKIMVLQLLLQKSNVIFTECWINRKLKVTQLIQE